MPESRGHEVQSIEQDVWPILAGLHEATIERLLALIQAPSPQVLGDAGLVLDTLAGELASILGEAILAAALAGGRQVGQRLPADSPSLPKQSPPVALQPVALPQHLATIKALPPAWQASYLDALPPAVAGELVTQLSGQGGAPPVVPRDAPAGESPGVSLPLIEEAARDLQARKLLSYRDVEAMQFQARRQALAVAGELTSKGKAKLQSLLVEAISEGQSQREFQERFSEELPRAVISEAALSTTFRTAVQSGYSAGMDQILAHPLVGDAFPYEERLPIRDSRLSDMCAIASRAGIQGTGIFRRDDPTWDRLKPPLHPNCRCGRSPLSLEQAARRGIREAVRWLETGQPPASPAWVPMPALPRR